jgi:hypothetical protein
MLGIAGSSDVPIAARPSRPQPLASDAVGHGAHGHVQFAIGISALAGAAVVALLWLRWRVTPSRTRKEKQTALV